MAIFSGSKIANAGLIFNLDPLNAKSNSLTSVDVLVVGGGGGGGFEMGGGGGAGGVVYSTNFTVTPGTSYTVTVGAGGAGRTSNADNTNSAINSVFSTITAYGGGAGGNNSYTYDGTNTGGRPMAGGSGGGSGEGQSTAPGTSGQGNAGGAAIEAGYYHSGGGGGACTSGQWGQMYGAGNGGLGLAIPINGSYYGGGGAGGSYAPGNPIRAATGGTGGGGNANLGAAGSNASANTGGGGGGGSYSPSSVGGNGGSGIVIVKYIGPQRATGGTVTRSGNYTVHTFTTSGTFAVLSSTSIIGSSDLSQTTFATAVNSPTYTSGYVSLNGSNQYLTAPMSTLRPTYITLECWFYQNSISGDQVFIGSQYGSSSGNSYALWKNGDTWLGGVNTTGSFAYLSTSYASSINTWYHFVYTYNGSTEKLYVNGSEISSGSRTGSIVYDNTLNNTLLAIGGDWNGSGYDTGISALTNGRLGVVRIYSRGLSSSEVNTLFQATRDRYGV